MPTGEWAGGIPVLIATNHMGSGLGNRLRFTLSCQAVAEAEGRRFYYHWPVGDGFGARFDELWEYHEPELELPGPKPYLFHNGSNNLDLSLHRDEPVLSLAGTKAVVGFGDEEKWEQKLRRLTPAAEASAVSSALLGDLGPNFIGVQVRAAPKAAEKTVEFSPVSWFVDRMLQIRSDDADTVFFLSCDDVDAQKTIMHRVPGIVAAEKVGGYNTRAGLLESVVDLLVLARSRHLIGPHWSSFVTMAWALADYEQDFETSQEQKLGKASRRRARSDSLPKA